jgi:hypothetical protein
MIESAWQRSLSDYNYVAQAISLVFWITQGGSRDRINR